MGLLGETANPSALGSLRKSDAWACQGSISKWVLLSAVLLSRASGAAVWNCLGPFLLGVVTFSRLMMAGEGRSLCVGKRESIAEGKCQVLECGRTEKPDGKKALVRLRFTAI